MAFKGTRAARRRAIAEEIEEVGGHLNAYTGRESTAYYAKRPGGRRRARARYPGRHPAALDLRPRGAGARAAGGPAGDRPGRGHAGRHRLRPLPGDRLSRSGDGPAGAGPRRDRLAAGPRSAGRLPGHQLRRRPDGAGRRRAHRARLAGRAGGGPVRRPARARRGRAAAGALRRRRAPRAARARAGAHRAGLPRRRGARPAHLRRGHALDAARRRHVLAPVPGGAREARPGLLDLLLRLALPGRRALRALRRHRRERGGRAHARGGRGAGAR